MAGTINLTSNETNSTTLVMTSPLTSEFWTTEAVYVTNATSASVNATVTTENATVSVSDGFVQHVSVIFLQTAGAQGIAGAVAFIAILITGFQVKLFQEIIII